jgi:nitrate reductase NapAB chaperone NapD
MAIAGAVVVPTKREFEEALKERLNSLEGVDVQAIGEKGIAVVLEAKDSGTLKAISEKIDRWEEVVAFQLAYINWE